MKLWLAFVLLGIGIAGGCGSSEDLRGHEVTESDRVVDEFVRAYNLGDLDALEALLAPDATAQVLGSNLPIERGSKKIRDTSLAYLLGDGTDELVAERWDEDSVHYVLLREPTGARDMDSAIRIEVSDGRIRRLEYLVLFHKHDELVRIGELAGIELRSVNE